ncbi:MAG TPA: hypothetical protein VFS89_03730 [Nitrosospira sp.]|nr:hypothetical protein [Nitrosospira sp.]
MENNKAREAGYFTNSDNPRRITVAELDMFGAWAISEGRSVKLADPDYAVRPYASAATNNALDGWLARQPEIDALMYDNSIQREACRALGRMVSELRDDKTALKAEVEQMLEAIKEVDVLIRNNLPVDKTTPAWDMIKKILYK